MNSTQLIGYLGAKPEFSKTKNGISVASFDLAVQRKYKNSEGEYLTDWFRIVAWRGLADLVVEHLDKGSRIGVTGSLETGSYEKDGAKIKTHQVIANEITFLSQKADSQPKDPFSNEKVEEVDDSNLPF